MIRFAILTLVWTAAFARNADTVLDSDALLQRIRTRMVSYVSQLPNYTCHQVVDRFLRSANSGRLEPVDRVEFEVAFVGNMELFAKPGAERFEEQSISTIVPNGTIGNGGFASHVQTLFLGNVASFEFFGRSKKHGHTTFRYDFRVPREKSRFLVRHGSRNGIIGYRGSFWVDAETLDPVRLEIRGEDIPPQIGVRSVDRVIRYTPTRVVNSEVLLPRKSEMTATDEVGNYSLNIISLEKCREFTGQSVVTYSAPAEGKAAGERIPDN